nr:MAG TPA: hypothetical protein [Caudoviricetes sp.]
MTQNECCCWLRLFCICGGDKACLTLITAEATNAGVACVNVR